MTESKPPWMTFEHSEEKVVAMAEFRGRMLVATTFNVYEVVNDAMRGSVLKRLPVIFDKPS